MPPRTRTKIAIAVFATLTLFFLSPLEAEQPAASPAQAVDLHIDPSVVKHTMASGGGASWHVMGPETLWYEGLINRSNRRARGSAWGGNPPISYTEAWKDLSDLASWLGMDFIRVEIDMKMYEPERGKFTWESHDMKTLYRILDHCQKAGVDVFLTQMWADVEWNAIPGVNRLQSAPNSVEDFAVGLATLVDYLVKTKGYTCIRWLCIVNEPGRPGSWWQGSDKKGVSLMPALHAVRAELDRRGIPIGLCAPDWTDPTWSSVENTPEFDFNDKVVEAFDAHNYESSPSVDLMKVWVDKARGRGVPFLLTEFGSNLKKVGNGTQDVRAYENQLLNAEKIIEGLNIGIDAFNRWSFTNRGDLDGQWQLVRTFNPETWEYSKRVTPVPASFYSHAILTRFMSKRSDVLKIEGETPTLRAAALRSPHGNLTFYCLNKSTSSQPVSWKLAPWKESRTFYKYQIDGNFPENFQMNPMKSFEISEKHPFIEDTVPGSSITVYSTYKLTHDALGIIQD